MIYFPLVIIAILHLYASFSSRKIGHIGPLIMSIGSILILAGVLLSLNSGRTMWIYILTGTILIIDSAIYNGYRKERINWIHHAIRLLIITISLAPLF